MRKKKWSGRHLSSCGLLKTFEFCTFTMSTWSKWISNYLRQYGNLWCRLQSAWVQHTALPYGSGDTRQNCLQEVYCLCSDIIAANLKLNVKQGWKLCYYRILRTLTICLLQEWICLWKWALQSKAFACFHHLSVFIDECCDCNIYHACS